MPDSIITFSCILIKPNKLLRHFKATKRVSNSGGGGKSEEIPLLCLPESELSRYKTTFCSWETSQGIPEVGQGRGHAHCYQNFQSVSKKEKYLLSTYPEVWLKTSMRTFFTAEHRKVRIWCLKKSDWQEYETGFQCTGCIRVGFWRPGRVQVTSSSSLLGNCDYTGRGRKPVLRHSSYLWSPLGCEEHW